MRLKNEMHRKMAGFDFEFDAEDKVYKTLIEHGFPK